MHVPWQWIGHCRQHYESAYILHECTTGQSLSAYMIRRLTQPVVAIHVGMSTA